MNKIPVAIWQEHRCAFNGTPLTADLREIILSLDPFLYDDEAKRILLGEEVPEARPASPESLAKAFDDEIKHARGRITHADVMCICNDHDWAYIPGAVLAKEALERYRKKESVRRQRQLQRKKMRQQWRR